MLRNENQHAARVCSGSHEQRDPYAMPFIGGARIRKADGRVYVKETVMNADGSYGSTDERDITGDLHYEPQFVVRAITTTTYHIDGDGNELGIFLYVDMPQFEKMPVRLFPWWERMYQVTRVHLGALSDDYDVILAK